VPIFFENKSVYENLVYVAKMQLSRPSQIESLVNEVLIDFNIEGFKDIAVADLTLYQKYIVSLARLSLRKIDIMLVDAVFDSLEAQERDKIIEILKQKFINDDSIFILSTEDEKLAQKLTTRQIYFENGSIVGESA
jgi:ABC-type transport system involved in cytochrome c biogenesis ATPase subunit